MSDKKTKLWQKDAAINQRIEAFTVGKDRELDLYLAEYDVLGSMAHIEMLATVGLLLPAEKGRLKKELVRLLDNIRSGTFKIEDGVEDVHSQVELQLTRVLGDMGKKIHAGRSRNDQVLLDLKLFMRDRIKMITQGVDALFERLISLSEKHAGILMPGYTHMQVAMPSSFGLWFGAFAEGLADDMKILGTAFEVINRNPLGSAAGYGSSFPLDRQLTTDLLGFESMNYNVVYAQMGRGKAERILAGAMAVVADTIGRFAQDVCLYMGQDYGFFHFPDHLTTGSSIMPHKKNPDVFELVRAKCNRIKALPNEIGIITTNLPTGYHRDLQLIKESMIPAIDALAASLEMTEFMLQHIEVNRDIVEDKKYDYLFTVELVNKLVLEGMPFRDAYMEVGKRVAAGSYKPDRQVDHSHAGSIGNLCNEQIKGRFEKMSNWFDAQFEGIDLCLSRLEQS
jgi:argininosuccinate lyase